ncbi:unnamed protein product [Linum trigynum]|uniref:Uncharacterized protein n=1 Tax=Linum trigynum TaxID=586398 RepID=A0AAV2F6Q7_9ROSI
MSLLRLSDLEWTLVKQQLELIIDEQEKEAREWGWTFTADGATALEGVDTAEDEEQTRASRRSDKEVLGAAGLPSPPPTTNIPTIFFPAAVEKEDHEATATPPTAKDTTMAPSITSIITIIEHPTLNGKALSSAEMMTPSLVTVVVVLNTALPPPPPIIDVVDSKTTMSSVASVASCA